MDFKLNTLQYFTEPGLLEKINSDNKCSHKDEISFYKKRIFLTTKLLLRNNKINPSVNNAFNNYARILIQHFKIVDTNDILQEEFKNMINTDNESNNKFNNEIKPDYEIESEANSHIFIKQTDETEGTLNNFVKMVHTRPEKKMIMPKQRMVNLKNPHLRNKGINKNK
jgi:hypothetical protein